jgi:pimeloyl-ACP methyl ester carboxylesterase
VLLLHGLLQSSGTFCCNDDSSLAFYLCKSGYDVWLGNDRGYFKPKHRTLKSSNREFWAWNLSQMGCLDVPALVDYVRAQTGRPKVFTPLAQVLIKIAFIAHSQGTTLGFLALAKDQVPRLGNSLSCFIALAPAVYAGTLLETFQFSFVKIMSPKLFRAFFGINSFVPLMMFVHKILPGSLYGWFGYRVFNFLFGWTDVNWERRLRNRFFQFSPLYISSESMRWWLGRGDLTSRKG